MEQKLRFGLVLGCLAVLIKNIFADYEQLLRAFFSCFRGQSFFYFIFENTIASALKSCIITNIHIRFFFFEFFEFFLE